jgi:hypothetical protein
MFSLAASKIGIIALALMAGVLASRAADGNQQPAAIIGATQTRHVGELTYRVALVEDQGGGIIGVELKWRNDSTTREMLEKKQNQSPLSILVRIGSQQLKPVPGPIYRDASPGIAISKGMEIRYLEPGTTAVYFVDIRSVIDPKSVLEERKDCTITVRPLVYVVGAPPSGIDTPLKGETFKNCRLTPEGLALDARQMHERLLSNKAK